MKWKLLFSFTIIMATSGCKDIYLPTTPTRDPTEINDSRTSTPTMIYPTFTIEPTQTETPNPSRTTTPSPTYTPETSLTPLPTIHSYHSLMNYISLTGNADCHLPCWAGITPGKTKWDDAVNLLKPINNFVEMRISEDIESASNGKLNYLDFFYFSDSEYETVRFDGYLTAHLVNEEMVVDKLYTHFDNSTRPQGGGIPSIGLPLPGKLSLRSVLQEHGITDLVFLDTDLGVPEYPKTALFLDLVYPDDHFIITYIGWAYVSGGYIFSCDSHRIVSVRIIDNKDVLVSKESIQKADLPSSEFFYLGEEFQDVTDIPIDIYFEDYINSDSNCLTFPIDAWRYMLGED
jgi:hypothetical protein